MNALVLRPLVALRPGRLARSAGIALLALGVVYGDIGTSPLYALKIAFTAEHGLPLGRENVLGILSLTFWVLTVVVSIKYVSFILRADNRGEGGILALVALALSSLERRPRLKHAMIVLALVGAAMFYGDSVITPAISVMSAVEGLEVVSPALAAWVVPLTLVILVALFALQHHGTAAVGRMFGPVMLVWFAAIGLAGLSQITRDPGVLEALNPLHAARLGVDHPAATFVLLAAIFLVVTGAEALYADMGHFGRFPVRLAWFSVVMPALVLNYFGQGAYVLAHPDGVANPFYLMLPQWAQPPMVLLATAATVIASQAVISGAYSLTAQAIQLGYSPRMTIEHTSSREMGQIYMPFVNWVLFVAVVALVLGFRKSDNLAAAYGIAVSTTMLVTSMLAIVVARTVWGWSELRTTLILGALVCVDVLLFAANTVKIAEGGWFPVTIGGLCLLFMLTWLRGRNKVFEQLRRDSIPLYEFVRGLASDPNGPARVPGVAVFLTGDADAVPHALLHNLKHNMVMHETVVFMTITTRPVPLVPADERLVLTSLAPGLHQLRAYVGFKEEPDVVALIDELRNRYGLVCDPMRTSYFLSRETLVTVGAHGIARWRERLFAWMARNAMRAHDYFRIPSNRVVELGSVLEI
ncbi:MAG TPA: potassium transporter Kup [Casimicrobiaceae bacterium]|jgi:KUP system potassium uptake protein